MRDDEAAQVVAELYRFDLELYNTASVGGDDAGGGATGGVDDGRHCTYAESENVALAEPALAAALHKVLQSMVVSPLTARGHGRAQRDARPRATRRRRYLSADPCSPLAFYFGSR